MLNVCITGVYDLNVLHDNKVNRIISSVINDAVKAKATIAKTFNRTEYQVAKAKLEAAEKDINMLYELGFLDLKDYQEYKAYCTIVQTK